MEGSASVGLLHCGPEKTIYFKVVACAHGRYISIYDGRTRYSLNTVTEPLGGCWVCPSLMAVTEHATRLPSRSILLDAPRVFLRVAGWNEYGAPPPFPEGHPPSDTKLLVSHVMPLEVWPYEELMRAAGRLSSEPKKAPTSPSPVSIAGLIDAFASAFPQLSLHLLRCAGQLAVQCGAHGYDRDAWLTFHSCGAESPWAPAPVVIRVLRDVTGSPYSLAAALCDVEACLAWIVSIGGPCELVLTPPDGLVFQSAEVVYAKAMPEAADGPRRVRGHASPMAALLPPATWEGETAYRAVEVPCTGSYSGYSVGAHFPRLCALLEPPPSARPMSAMLTSSASAQGADSARRKVALAAHAAVSESRTKGFAVGTAHASSGAPCAELVAARRAVWATSADQMHSVAGALASLEARLPPARSEPSTHSMIIAKLAGSEQPRRRSRRSPRRYPSPRSLADVFAPARFPPADRPRERQKRADFGSYETACRVERAKLYRQAAFRGGAAFESAQVDARAKKAGGDTVLDELDLAVLSPPAWSSAPVASASSHASSPRPWQNVVRGRFVV